MIALARYRRSWFFRPVLATAILLLLLLLRGLWESQHVKSCVSADVKSELDRAGHANIEVLFNPKPEKFNLVFLKDLGNFAGVEGKTVRMVDVDRAGVDSICRQYWIKQIVSWNGS